MILVHRLFFFKKISLNVQFSHKQKFLDTSGQSFRLSERKKKTKRKKK